MASITTWNAVQVASYLGRDLPTTRCIFDYSLLYYLQNVKNKSILDIACGEGRFCRLLKTKGASRVIGVDIAPTMIKKAQEENRRNFFCEYKVGDASSLGLIGQFDFVTSINLLPYAGSVKELKSMCRNFYDNLKPGGTFVGLGLNCLIDADYGKSLEKYEMSSFNVLQRTNEATNVEIIFSNTNDIGLVFSLIALIYKPEVYEAAFNEAGFSSFSLKPVQVDPQRAKEYPDGHWAFYNSKPAHLCYIAKK